MHKNPAGGHGPRCRHPWCRDDPAWQKPCKQNRSVLEWFEKHRTYWFRREKMNIICSIKSAWNNASTFRRKWKSTKSSIWEFLPKKQIN